MICERPHGLWSFGHDQHHMKPPQHPEEFAAQSRPKQWMEVQRTDAEPVNVLTKGRKKGIAARDGKPERGLFE